MPYGMPVYQIENINISHDPTTICTAEVVFNEDDQIDDTDVTHCVRVKVRVKVPENATLQSVQEILHRRAVDLVFQIVSTYEAMSAQDALSHARSKFRSQDV